jgi:serine/threonine-protein kinase
VSDPFFERLRAALGDRYLVEGEIGRGGMAAVYVAQDVKHARAVAIKVLDREVAAGLGAERFLREIQIAARLHHPHILPLYDSGETDGVLYYVMPLAEGETLRDRLERDGRLPVGEALRVAREVLGALHYAHGHGIVHRDIKPENIFLENGHAVVADFGIARAVDAARGATLTQPGATLGTPQYMSPEQIEGKVELDGRSDVYSLACVLFEMVCGKPPFSSPTISGVLTQHLTDQPPPLRRERVEVPPEVDAAVSRAMAKSPAERFGSAAEFAAALGLPVTGELAPPRRRAVPRAAIAAAAVLVALAGLWGVRQRFAARAEGAPTVAVAVLPFSVGGSDAYRYLGEGLVTLLSTKLDGAGELRSVDPRAVLNVVMPRAAGVPAPDRAREVAARFGARLYVLGDVLEASGRLQITAGLYDLSRGGDAVARASVSGAADRIFELVDELAAQLLAGWSGEAGEHLGQLAAMTTHSLPALKSYLEGDRAYRLGDYGAALAAFQRAVEADSLFALAWYKISATADWLVLTSLGRSAAERALRLADRLPERERLLLRANATSRRGELDQAENLYRGITGTYPDDVEAWLQLSEMLFHNGPLLGRPVSESRAPWERVRALEPNHVAAYVHLARIAALDRDLAGFDSLLGRIQALQVASQGAFRAGARAQELELLVLRSFIRGDRAEEERSLGALDSASDIAQLIALFNVAAYGPGPTAGLRVADVLTSSRHSTMTRALGHVMKSYFELGRGRRRAMLAQLDTVEGLDRATAAEHGAHLLTTIDLEAGRPLLEATRAELGRIDPTRVPAAPPGSNAYFTAHDGVHRPIKTFLDGMLAVNLDQRAEALRRLAELEAIEGGGDEALLARTLAPSLRATMAYREGRAAEALAALERLPPPAFFSRAAGSPFFAETRERFLRAVLLDTLGRGDEALQWYASLERGSQFDTAYLGPSYLRRARLYERLGRPNDAVRYYRRFVELWHDADPDLQPMVREAEAALGRLEGGAR